MPIYEYLLVDGSIESKYKSRFEDLDPAEIYGIKVVKRVITSAPSVQFRGAGFHANDYSKKGAPPVRNKSEPRSTDHSPVRRKAAKLRDPGEI